MFGFFLNSRRLVGRRWIQWREWDWSRWVYYSYLQEILSVYVQYNLEKKTKPNQLATLVLFQCYKIEIKFAKCRSLNSRCLWALAFWHFVQWARLYCAFEFNIESVCIGNPQVTLDPKPKETVDWEMRSLNLLQHFDLWVEMHAYCTYWMLLSWCMKYWISKFTTWWSWFQRTKKVDQKPHLSWASVIAIMLAILMSIAVPCNRIYSSYDSAPYIIPPFLGDRDEVLLQHLTHESKYMHAYWIHDLNVLHKLTYMILPS